MRRALFLAVVIAGCGWGALLAMYGVLAVQIFSSGAVAVHHFIERNDGHDKERLLAIITVSALGLLGSTALPMTLSRKGRNGAALAAVCFGLAAMLPAGFVTVLWQPWDYPYCWICP
jgi:hypothetical protein